MTDKYWTSCYASEKPFHIGYAGTSLDRPRHRR